MTSILVVTERYWPDGGGGELATHLVVGVLKKRFDVTVVTGTESPSRVPGVEYVYEPLIARREKPALWLSILRLASTQSFRELLSESDVVYVPRFALPIIPYAKRLNKKVVVHLHDYIPISYTATILAPYEEHKHRITRDDMELECMKGLKHCLGVSLLWWLPRLARRWVSQADKVVCVSRRQAGIIVSQVPELEGRVEVIYNPLPPELVNVEPRKDLDSVPTFLYVGGDGYVKGFHILLQALNKLGRQGIKARFILTNRYSPRNLEILKRLGEKRRNLEIQVVGRVDYEELLEIHKKAWALLFPSIWEEPLPYAIVEASLLGSIPIASKVGEVSELLYDTPASEFLFFPGQTSGFEKDVKKICEYEPSEIVHLGYKQRVIMLKKLDPVKISENILRLFTNI